MPKKISPFLNSAYGWDLGEGNWNEGVDEDILKFSFLLDRNVDQIVSSLPTPAVSGTAYFLTTDSQLYYAVGGAYYSVPTPKWFTFQIKNSGVTYTFDGTSLQNGGPTTIDGGVF